MDFILGIIIGFGIGGLLMHIAHEYIDSMLKKDDEK
jgi:F0F1-type ATP synthase assembly protein I